MKKGIVNALALLLIVLLLAAMTACGGETVEEPETEEPALLQAEGTLVSYEKGELTLQTEDGELSFLMDAETSFSLARGFIAGDVFVVSYEEGDEAASSVTSTANDELEPYTLRGTVRAVSGAEMTLALEEGGKASFSIAAAELDLWQGLREGVYVELCCLGDAAGGSCVWVQRVADNDGEGYLTPAEETEATDEMASGEPVGEETTEETSEEDAREWPYEPCEDTVWPSVRANLRIGPGMEYPCVGEAECGEELTRCGVSGEWSAVLIDGREYYVATELLLTERPGKLSTIEYDANGGMAAPETQHKLSGEQLVLSQLVPVRKGWHFVHWNTHEKGYGMIFEPGAVYALDGDITLYAQWEEGEPEPETEEPTVSEEMTGESAEETTEETMEEAEPVRDSSSAIAGTLISLEDGRLCLQAAGLEYEFDISAATLTAESGVHPGDLVTVRYAGTLGAERDSAAAPAVRVTVTTGEPEESGKLTAVGADLAAISTGKTELFAAVEAPGAEVGESVTLCLSAADGNLFTATVK